MLPSASVQSHFCSCPLGWYIWSYTVRISSTVLATQAGPAFLNAAAGELLDQLSCSHALWAASHIAQATRTSSSILSSKGSGTYSSYSCSQWETWPVLMILRFNFSGCHRWWGTKEWRRASLFVPQTRGHSQVSHACAPGFTHPQPPHPRPVLLCCPGEPEIFNFYDFSSSEKK